MNSRVGLIAAVVLATIAAVPPVPAAAACYSVNDARTRQYPNYVCTWQRFARIGVQLIAPERAAPGDTLALEARVWNRGARRSHNFLTYLTAEFGARGPCSPGCRGYDDTGDENRPASHGEYVWRNTLPSPMPGKGAIYRWSVRLPTIPEWLLSQDCLRLDDCPYPAEVENEVTVRSAGVPSQHRSHVTTLTGGTP